MRDASGVKHNMRKLQTKLDLLYRKDQRFGLTQEELEKYREMRIKFQVLHEELIDIEFERVFLTYLLDKEDIVALKTIQNLIPWNGGFVLKDTEFEKILEAEMDLTEKQRKIIEDNLNKVHYNIFKNLEELLRDDYKYDYALDIAKFVKNSETANIDDLVRYIDDRYRDFAEMLRIELEELDVDWIEN